MSHYDLNRMGWQQFEQMVQSLALCELGNGLRLFGAGADGRREASFRGRMNFPVGRGDQTWNGYGVLQVKHLERPKNTTADWNWFIDQVRDELEKWVAAVPSDGKVDPEKFPKYFIFATNVTLTGTEGTGGVDRFESLMDSYKRRLHLQDWFAWDYSQIRGFLDKHPSVRQTYLEQICVGDFLSQLETLLPRPVALTAKALAVQTANELVTRQWARIGDSGYGDSSKLRLSAIGIDLPSIYLSLTTDGKISSSSRTNVGSKITMLADEICRPADGGKGARGAVIIGGPGQGKSTVAQLIAHNYRVAFVKDSAPGSLGPKTDDALKQMNERLRKQNFPLPTRRRWPIFVDLAAFGASAASKIGPVSLLDYIADGVFVAGERLSAPSLLNWIASWPTILVLDGLDEVPDARTRTRIMDAIGAFVTETSSVNADLFVVGTTRPQGYQDEFSEVLDMGTAILAEFSESEALEYAEAIISLRSDDDPEQATQVTLRLIDAIHQRLTQRLMTTPLQVTIMTALAERAVDLPTTRYELFDSYYSTIYDREVGKTPSFKKLRKMRSHIDFLHEQAGLGLQIRNERPAAADRLLSRKELSRMLLGRLRNAGFDAVKADLTTKDLLRLASERLVLLISPHGKMHGFEVRSIQEYMAARAITEGPDEVVLARLRVILPSAHWRNTWLLAAGRLLETREHLGQQLVDLVKEADHGDYVARAVKAGASLAADLYNDGLAFDFPHLRSSILETALERMSDTAVSMDRSLVELVSMSVGDDEYEGSLLSKLDEISSRSASNLASKLFSEYRHSPDPIGEQARATLRGGRRYSKPENRAAGSRSFVLGTHLMGSARLESPRPDAADVGFAGILLKNTGAASKAEVTSAADDDLPTTSPEVFSALESAAVRNLLAKTVDSIRMLEPDVSHYGTLLLRYRESRQLRGDYLPGPTYFKES